MENWNHSLQEYCCNIIEEYCCWILQLESCFLMKLCWAFSLKLNLCCKKHVLLFHALFKAPVHILAFRNIVQQKSKYCMKVHFVHLSKAFTIYINQCLKLHLIWFAACVSRSLLWALNWQIVFNCRFCLGFVFSNLLDYFLFSFLYSLHTSWPFSLFWFLGLGAVPCFP